MAKIERDLMQRVVLHEACGALTQLIADLGEAKVAFDAAAVDARIIGGWRHSVFGDAARKAAQGPEYSATLEKFIEVTRERRDALRDASELAAGPWADPLMPVAHTLRDSGFSYAEIARLLTGTTRQRDIEAIKQRLRRFRRARRRQKSQAEKPRGPLTVGEVVEALIAGGPWWSGSRGDRTERRPPLPTTSADPYDS